MTHLLDTDVLSIWQSAAGPEHAVLTLRMSAHPAGAVGVAVVSFHEQFRGSHSYLNRAKRAADLIEGYRRLTRVFASFSLFPVLPFDAEAAAALDGIRALNTRVGDMDFRIAAIARAHNLTLVTRNARDFGRMPGLALEDWTR